MDQVCCDFMKDLSVIFSSYKIFTFINWMLNVIADAYVSDEIIVARSGKRVRIGNTDAEGRMVMADVLCHMKEKVHTTEHSH